MAAITFSPIIVPKGRLRTRWLESSPEREKGAEAHSIIGKIGNFHEMGCRRQNCQKVLSYRSKGIRDVKVR